MTKHIKSPSLKREGLFGLYLGWMKPKTYFTLILSLLLVTTIAGYLVLSKAIPKKEYCLEIIFCNTDTSSWSKAFNALKVSKERHYELFKLTTDTNSNNLTLERARKTLNKIKYTRDTINGIHILLDDSTPYSYFIKALDICDEKFPGAFAPFQNNIWALYLKIDTIDVPKEVLDKWRRKYGRL
jgi:hypothetical protein